MSALAAAAERFVAVYHAHPRLVEEQRGWSCTIALVAADDGDAVTVRVDDGRVTDVAAHEQAADLVITADRDTLRDVLELRRHPNEPYIFGELTVRGPERDFLRLDYITTLLCR